MSAKRLPGLHQIWDTHHSRPPNSCPSIITPLKPSIAVQGGSRGLHTRRRRRTVPTQKPPLQGGLWKLTPFEQLPLEKIAQTSEIRNNLAIAKRWTGRRGLFLGNYKNRRDGAFASQENPGVDLENLHDPIIDRIFNSTVSLGGQGTSVGWPCVREARHTRRDFGVGQKFAMDFDLSGIDLFVQAARRELAGKNMDLKESSPKFEYNKPKSTNWPDARRSRHLSIQLYGMMKKLLKNEEPVVIRAVYQHLIDNYRTRPYLPGLLRLMIKSLLLRGEWRLLQYLCSRAFQKKNSQQVLSNRDVAALVNYAISVSTKLRRGQKTVYNLYRFARQERREDPKGSFVNQVRWEDDLLHTHAKVPAIFQIDNPVVEKISEEPQRPGAGPHPGSIYNYLADANIRFRLANKDLPKALKAMETLAESYYVPSTKTVNAILRELIRLSSLKGQQIIRGIMALPRPTIRRRAVVTVRTYSTAIPVLRVPSVFNYLGKPWLHRTLPWLGKWQTKSKETEEMTVLNRVLRFLNENNINPTTIKLLSKFTSSESELEIPWEMARRAKHPKTVVRQAQSALLEAACRLSSKARHVTLSRGILMIMRLEGMGITPSEEALTIALRNCVEQGNLLGARALVDRIEYYQHTLRQEDIAKILEKLPCMEPNALITPAGTLMSPMYVRTEQLQFIMELRPYITDSNYLGPYIRAVGRCGSAVEIWRVWELLAGKKVKDGILTAMVESFVRARDLSSAMRFVKVAYKEGYTLNFLRARAIAGAVKKEQRGIGTEMLREMIVQKVEFGRVEEILHLILSSQGITTASQQGEIVKEVALELKKMMMSVREGKDIPDALDEMDRILDMAGKRVE